MRAAKILAAVTVASEDPAKLRMRVNWRVPDNTSYAFGGLFDVSDCPSGQLLTLLRFHPQELGELLTEVLVAELVADRAQQLIQRQFGVWYHPNYVGRLMAQLGLSSGEPLLPASEEPGEVTVFTNEI